MRKAERQAIKNIIGNYCHDGQSIQQLARDMGTDGVTFVQGGGLAIYNDDMFDELAQVYGDTFNANTYKTRTGEWRHKNGIPYVFMVYCYKFGKVLDELKAEA